MSHPQSCSIAEVPRFTIGASEDNEALLSYLNTHGYVVVRNILNENEIEEGKALFWQYIKESNREIDRANPETWKKWPGDSRTGIISGTICHSDFLWYLRLHPKVKEIFCLLWGTDDLLTSFDGGNSFRPWSYDPTWKTSGGWWHVDQNSLRGPERTGRVSIQGLVTFYDATEATGGFAAIPGSHRFHDALCAQQHGKIDFIGITPEDSADLQHLPHHLIQARAGDMILWDSRCVHCNVPAITSPSDAQSVHQPEATAGPDKVRVQPDLLRLVGYVCMQPKSMATQTAIHSRKLGLLLEMPTSHWATKEIETELIEWFQERPDCKKTMKRILTNAPPEKLRLSGFSEEEIERRICDGVPLNVWDNITCLVS